MYFQKMYLNGLMHGNFYYEKTEFNFHDRSEIGPGGTVTIWSSGESPISFLSVGKVSELKNNINGSF